MDFLPRSITSAGISSYFVLTMNSATYLVSPGAFGNSVAGTGDAYRRPRPSANAETAREFLNKSRRFMTARLQVIKSRGLEYYALFIDAAILAGVHRCRQASSSRSVTS